MSARPQLQLEANLPVRIVLLDQQDREVPGQTINLSGHTLRLWAEAPIPINSAVRINLPDGCVLGEVCFCAQELDRYLVGLEVEQAIPCMSDLARLVAKLMYSDRRAAEAPKQSEVFQR